jgi:hypothetical protein
MQLCNKGIVILQRIVYIINCTFAKLGAKGYTDIKHFRA